ncbi:MAG: hypothetical protein R2932_59065 [Caldilineaceae bacterium]
MSYKLTSFDQLTLPTYNRESGIDTGPSQPGYLPTVNGSFDVYGADVAPVNTPFAATLRCIVSEETDAGQRAAIDALRAKARTRGKLVRQSDDTATHWAWARLSNVQYRRPYSNRGYQILDFTWSLESEWYADRIDQEETLDGSPFTLSVENEGNRAVTNAIITITSDDASLTAVTLTTTNGTHLIWTGTVTAGNDLVIDCGAKSIKNNGANAYSGLSYGGNHSIDDWLRIVGAMDITITYTGGGSAPTVTIAYNDGWM